MFGPFDFDFDEGNILDEMFIYGEVTGDDILGIHSDDRDFLNGGEEHDSFYESDSDSDF